MSSIASIQESVAKSGLKRRRDNILEHDRTIKKRKDSKNNSENEDTDFMEQKEPLMFQHDHLPQGYAIPKQQERLLLHGKRQRYELDHTYQIPEPNPGDEVLVKVQYIGLNPIDWKAPDFGFGIPWLPYIAGREFVGQVVATPLTSNSTSARKIRLGDIVLSASTDYRDRRKAAFQELTVAPTFNLCRVPTSIGDKSRVAGLGVAFVAAALTLGVCLGVDFERLVGDVPRGPNLKAILKSVPVDAIPIDVRAESFSNIVSSERPVAGDWLVIWGGSSATACVLAQLAKHSGLRVIKVVDVAKHGARLSEGPADLIVDAYDTNRAVDIIRQVTKGKLRFGVDTVGTPTATLLQQALCCSEKSLSSHLVGLTGLPNDPMTGVTQHIVPIKLHHEVPAIGEAMMVWLEKLLASGNILPPEVEVLGGGLSAVNEGLDRMRRGEISGRRLAVHLA
ncbi:uncharacterized protein PV09_05205 [Verruconis gallopava]|uniref:Alcohol dehydrogenase-like N-terminal domain-containing protein n=1 Tax=Verruconis gallopava TaxID=253628 RepID=A0A0D2AA30_9PEZI|nr:uncharacterized protein PV09_05205 [Verruconis gallopava]KIW03435.1 hypothetical protein PV09_05205 [Verruconis gallopava]